MLRGPLHNKGADRLCEECGEPFPCPTSIAYEAVKREAEAPDQIQLVLTGGEVSMIVAALRARGLHSFADRLEAVLRLPNRDNVTESAVMSEITDSMAALELDFCGHLVRWGIAVMSKWTIADARLRDTLAIGAGWDPARAQEFIDRVKALGLSRQSGG